MIEPYAGLASIAGVRNRPRGGVLRIMPSPAIDLALGSYASFRYSPGSHASSASSCTMALWSSSVTPPREK
jgi:hypothetical protein